MFTTVYTLFTLASIVTALVIPRAVPKSYDSAFLEPYATYHSRYLALGCENQHGKAFFDTCCHPLLAHESLSTRPKQCHPSGEEQSDDGDDDCGSDDTTEGAKSSTTAHAHGAVHTGPARTTTANRSTKTTNGGNGGSNVNTGGVATFFFQNGVAGACGRVHKDTDLICAMGQAHSPYTHILPLIPYLDAARYGNAGNSSPLCGKQVQITNQKNGHTVTVTVADDCPTCNNGNSIDLSKSAFQQLADLSEGEVPIAWKFV
jgi:hypothetical protein